MLWLLPLCRRERRPKPRSGSRSPRWHRPFRSVVARCDLVSDLVKRERERERERERGGCGEDDSSGSDGGANRRHRRPDLKKREGSDGLRRGSGDGEGGGREESEEGGSEEIEIGFRRLQ
ncbi:hypothetical protein LOK49_LG05G02167 [Camellia lanceoleosa]|uniref:Uncharacterized protein n=1 Tax=Camellia lanceoleosa TaxID=1840588 RepID=A0ACC0HMK8_9ERIC|nr:hypothetical protein LOK49_LG05G02167 [Camellia lanceoleosa]